VKARGDKEFSPIYPLMLQLGTSLIEGGWISKWWDFTACLLDSISGSIDTC
jgi:hypothetical protein